MKWPPIGQILTSGMPGMAHMAGNEPNFDISSKKYDVQKTVPQKYKTAWALGLKIGGKLLTFVRSRTVRFGFF